MEDFTKYLEEIRERNNQEYLWRYFDLKGFLSFITNQELYFRRIDCFEDTWEGLHANLIRDKEFIPMSNFLNEISFKRSQNGSYCSLNNKLSNSYWETMLKNDEEKHNESLKRYFVNCWHLNKKESPLMWKIYSNSEGIAVKISKNNFDSLTQNLNENFQNFTFRSGKVEYIDIKEIGKYDFNKLDELSNKIGFVKDNGYSFENEIRIIASKKSVENLNDEKGNCFKFSIPISNFSGIYNPKAPKYFTDSINKIISLLQKDFSIKESEVKFN
jgi:hypothetical protein